jgi:hypothetical protein
MSSSIQTPIFVERWNCEVPRPAIYGDTEAREKYVAGDLYTGPLTAVNVPKLHTL